MKYIYSTTRKSHIIHVFGYQILIEYRVRLKKFDLIFYPNHGRMFGQVQFYDKYVCRHEDFTALMACIIKAMEKFSAGITYKNFYEPLKEQCSELILCEALKGACVTPCA